MHEKYDREYCWFQVQFNHVHQGNDGSDEDQGSRKRY